MRRVLTRLVTVIAAGLVVGCGDGSTAPSPPPLAPSGFIDSDGLKIHYESFGEGDPIILVHGWGVGLEFNWVATGWVEALQSKRQVIALDVRGHGDSDKPHQQDLYSYSVMARDVLSLMDHFGIGRADLMGYSLGAFSGVHLLGHHQERFNSMILAGIGDETEESAAEAFVIADALRAASPSDITNPDGLFWRTFVDLDPRNDLEALALAALQMWPEGFPIELGGPGLSEVDIPVLIVNGAVDFPYVETDQNLAAAIPGAKLVTIPDRDHLTVLFDPLFIEEVLSFLGPQT